MPQGIRDIHESGFVTTFASVSPEEDFVETYKILSLSLPNPNLALSLVVRNPAGNVVGNFPILPSASMHASTMEKRTCVSALVY
jgi:hypothetical protein